MTWAAGALTPFDLETTGTDPAEARIVSATLALDDPGTTPTVCEWLVAVDVDIPAEASEVHGITTERARAEGRPIGDVLTEIVGMLAAAWSRRRPVVGMNLAYDFTVLDCELRRNGMPPLRIAGPVLDVYVIDKGVDKYRRGKRTLTDMAAFYGVALEGAHDATADAMAAAGIARVMCARADLAVVDPDAVAALYADRRFPRENVRAWQRLSGMPPAELFRQQQRWAAEQAHSFATYLQGQARDAERSAEAYPADDPDGLAFLDQAAELRRRAATVSRDWPVRVGVPGAGQVGGVPAPPEPVCQLPACGCSGLAHP